MATDFDDDEIVSQVSANLRTKFPDADDEAITAIVREELGTLADRPVRDYLMVLTERNAKKRLKKA